MRTKGSAAELERRRRLAVDRVLEGHAQTEVAHFLGVHVRTVQRWVEAYRKDGEAGLDARPHPGPQPRLLPEFVPVIRDWIRQPPHRFYRGQYLWTAKLLARRIKYQWGVVVHPSYLSSWLRQWRITPQKPELRPREHDAEELQRWLDQEWPRIKKKRGGSGRTSC